MKQLKNSSLSPTKMPNSQATQSFMEQLKLGDSSTKSSGRGPAKKHSSSDEEIQGCDPGQTGMPSAFGTSLAKLEHLLSEKSSSNSSTPSKNKRFDILREHVAEIVSNMGYEGVPIVRIKNNKYLIGTEVQYLQQFGSLVVVLDKSNGQELAPLSQFLAENIIKEVQTIDNLMNYHDKSLTEVVEMLLVNNKASPDVVKSVERQVSLDRYEELQ